MADSQTTPDAGAEAAANDENPQALVETSEGGGGLAQDDAAYIAPASETDGDLSALLDGLLSGSIDPNAPIEQPGTEQKVEQETGDEVATDTDDKPAEAEAESGLPERIRVPKNATPQDRANFVAIQDMMREKGMTLAQAVAELGISAPKTEPVTPEPAKEQPPTEKQNATIETLNAQLEAAEAELAAAEASYDAEAIKAARKTVNAVNRQIAKAEMKQDILAEMELRQKQAEVDTKAKQEWDAATHHIPEFSSNASLLAQAQTLLDKLPESFFEKPDPMGRVARMVWAEAYPDKQFPVKAERAEIRPPARPGIPVRGLTSTRGVPAPTAIPTNFESMSDAQLKEALRAFGGG